jgi:hypothetical protein
VGTVTPLPTSMPMVTTQPMEAAAEVGEEGQMLPITSLWIQNNRMRHLTDFVSGVGHGGVGRLGRMGVYLMGML